MGAWIAFGLFGFYVGSLTGLSSSPLTIALLPLLFTFAGGSIFAYFGSMTDETRRAAFSALGFASFGALLGTYLSIAINSNNLLGPRPVFTEQAGGYLRSDRTSNIEATLILLEQKSIEPGEAAKRIREELAKGDRK